MQRTGEGKTSSEYLQPQKREREKRAKKQKKKKMSKRKFSLVIKNKKATERENEKKDFILF